MKRGENEMLFTKCILHEPDLEDGVRISVMSRHTENDGVTPDLRIKQFDAHIPLLGPHPKLIGKYVRREIDWDTFEVLYRIGILKSPPKVELLMMLAYTASLYTVTTLCVEETADHCHRRILAELCQKYHPTLVVKHR